MIYGKSHRFAEVGQCQGFDSSPDGRTLVFAAGKLKFFDLKENRVTDEIGEPRESYNRVMYSPDGRYVLATTNMQGATLVRVFDAIDRSSIGTITTKKEDTQTPSYFYVQASCVSADAKYIALASHNEVQVRDVGSGELVCSLGELGYVQGMAFSPDETELYIPKNGQMQVIDLKTGELKKKSESKLVGQYGSVVDVNLARNLLAMPQSSSVLLYDLKQGQSVGSIPLPKQAYGQTVQFSDDGSLLSVNAWQQESGSSTMVAIILNVDTKKVIKTIKIPSQGITRQRFSADNKSLLISGYAIYGILEIPIENDDTLVGESYPVGPAQTGLLHPDGQTFMTASQGGEVTWFDAATGKVLRSIQKPNLRTVELTEDGSDVLLVSQWGNNDGITRVSYKTGKKEKIYGIKAAAEAGGIFSEIRKFMTNGQSNRVNSQAYALAAKLSEDGSELNALMMEMSWRSVPSGLGNTMEQEMSLRFDKMEMESGKRLASMKFNPEDFGLSKNEWVQTAAVRPDGLEFAIPHGTTIYVVDTQTGETSGEYPTKENGQIQSLGYSPKGRFMVASGFRGLWVWDVASGEVVKLIEEQGPHFFSFCKDGSRMVTSARGKNSTVTVFDTDSWKKIIDRKQTQADRNCIVLSDDGQKLLFGLTDCRLEIWDLAKVGN